MVKSLQSHYLSRWIGIKLLSKPQKVWKKQKNSAAIILDILSWQPVSKNDENLVALQHCNITGMSFRVGYWKCLLTSPTFHSHISHQNQKQTIVKRLYIPTDLVCSELFDFIIITTAPSSKHLCITITSVKNFCLILIISLTSYEFIIVILLIPIINYLIFIRLC